MGLVRNDFGELMVAPTLDYTGIPAGATVDATCRVPGCQEPGHPQENVYHWVAGGWTPLERYPVPQLLYPNHRNDPLAYPVAPPAPPAEAPADTPPTPAAAPGAPGPEPTALPAGAVVTPLPAAPAADIPPPGAAPVAEVQAASEGAAK